MTCRAGGPVSWRDTAAALGLAHVRYWLTVAPRVRRELRRWDDHAERIRDPVLRSQAVAKLRDERANTEVIATLCTLAPRPYRGAVIAAAVALQVMYDYLDALTEYPVAEPLEDGRALFRTFLVALTPWEEPDDYYRHHPQRDDSGYLEALVNSARESLSKLPALSVVLPIARDAVARFGDAQTHSHAVDKHGVGQLKDWALRPAAAADLSWWEWAGGAAASILGLHALLSAAADERTTRAQAIDIDRAYLLSSALTTMLDSLIDDDADASCGNHRYIAYYSDSETAICRIGIIARRAIDAASELPHPAHHVMTVAGIVAFYLSASTVPTDMRRTVFKQVHSTLGPVAVSILASFRLWRWLR